MHRKITVLCLIFLILLSHTAFAPIQAAEENAAGAFPSELVALLSGSDVVALVDVRRMLQETAPDLLNNEPASMEKLKKLAKLIEDETGIDPYQVNQIAAGLNLRENKPKDLALVVRTETPAIALAEKMFQKEAADARFTMEKNPLRNRLSNLRLRVDSFNQVFGGGASDTDTAAGAQNEIEQTAQKFAAFRDKYNELKSLVGEAKVSPAAVSADLNATIEKIGASLVVYTMLVEAAGKMKFEEEAARIAELEKELAAITASDPQRSQKLAAIASLVGEAEKSFSEKNRAIEMVVNFKDSEINSPISGKQMDKALELLKTLPAAAGARRTRSLQTVRTELTVFSNELEKRYREIEEKEGGVFETGVFFPTYVSVTKRDETIGGKKALVIITKSRQNGERGADDEGDFTAEKALLFYDEKTMIVGSKKDVTAQMLAGQTSPGNKENEQRMSRMLAKVPNSLVSFAVNLQGIDLGGLNDLLGDEDKVWEIYGGWTSVSKEMTLSVAVEKTDIPLVIAPKTAENGAVNKMKIPVIEDNSAAADLFKLLAKSLVGAEGKFTLKFEKRKIARLVRETPKLLGALLDDTEVSAAADDISK